MMDRSSFADGELLTGDVGAAARGADDLRARVPPGDLPLGPLGRPARAHVPPAAGAAVNNLAGSGVDSLRLHEVLAAEIA